MAPTAALWRSALAFAHAARAIRSDAPAARQATMTTVAVVIAVILACLTHLIDVWWAAISAYMGTQPTRGDALLRGVLRVCGTLAGALLALACIGWIAYDPVLCCLALFAVAALGMIGFSVSRFPYAWMLFVVTFAMIVLASLDDPSVAFRTAVSRILEVLVGTASAMAMSWVAGKPGGGAAARAPGWSDLLGRQLPVTLHAIRAGIAVAAVPVIWSAFALPGLSQMAITIVALLAIQVQADPHETHAAVIARGLQRLLGCFVGGIAALALLALDLESLAPWLLVLGLGVWILSFVQNEAPEASYVGTQAGIVFIMTMVQGLGPPSSILPGIDRFAGMFLGLLLLFAIGLLFSFRPAPRGEAVVR